MDGRLEKLEKLEERLIAIENANSVSVGAQTMLRNISIRDAVGVIIIVGFAVAFFIGYKDSLQADQNALRATHTADHSMMLDIVKRIETADSEAFSRIETSITKLSDRVDKLYNIAKSKDAETGPFVSKSETVHYRGVKE